VNALLQLVPANHAGGSGPQGVSDDVQAVSFGGIEDRFTAER
jgi:hypothetical protein